MVTAMFRVTAVAWIQSLAQELPSVEELTIILPEDIELKPLGMVSSVIEQLGK